jgi:hypothetical protein
LQKNYRFSGIIKKIYNYFEIYHKLCTIVFLYLKVRVQRQGKRVKAEVTGGSDGGGFDDNDDKDDVEDEDDVCGDQVGAGGDVCGDAMMMVMMVMMVMASVFLIRW